MDKYLVACALALFACTSEPGDGDFAGPDSLDSSSPDDGCGGLCGCSESVTLDFEATVVDAATAEAIPGIDLYCKPEDMPIATSDADGLVSFSIETEEQGGCGYVRCNSLRFVDPSGAYAELEVSTYASNGELVEMMAP